MMKKGKLLLCALLAVLCQEPAAAQDDQALFQAQAGGASLLYRGRKAYIRNELFNGTYYWSDPGYKKGSVVYNGKRYDDVLLNIDAARQDLLVRIPNSVIEKVVDERYTESFTIGDIRFLNLRFLCGETAPEGYWQVLHDGPIRFLLQVYKRKEQDLEGSKGNQTGYDGPYRDKVILIYTRQVAYCCLREDGTVVPVRRRRDLLKMFEPSLRREIRRHVNRREGDGMIGFELYCTEVLQYVESR